MVWTLQDDCPSVREDEHRGSSSSVGNTAQCMLMGRVRFTHADYLVSQASFYKIDIDNPDVQTSVSNYDISAVVSHSNTVVQGGAYSSARLVSNSLCAVQPTFKFFKGGSEVDKIIGPDVKTLWVLLRKHAQT